MSEAAKRFLLVLWMTAVAVVGGERAIEQFRRPGALTARGETHWFGWAYRDPALLARLERAEKLLSPGESVCIDATRSSVDSLWLRVMMNYSLWKQPPADACAAGNPEGPLTRIFISQEGAVTVVRRDRH